MNIPDDDLPPLDDEDRQFLHYNPNTDDLVEYVRQRERQAIAHYLKKHEGEAVAWGMPNSAITGSNQWMLLRERVPENDQYGGAMWCPLFLAPQPQAIEAAVMAEMLKTANDAATSLETISKLAGRKTYGDPPVETYMDTFMDVRGYAESRAKAARDEVDAIRARTTTPEAGE